MSDLQGRSARDFPNRPNLTDLGPAAWCPNRRQVATGPRTTRPRATTRSSLKAAPLSKIGVMTDPSPAAVASPPAPFSLSECETRTLQTGAVAVLRPVTPDMPARTDHDRLIASIHHDSDGWVRGYWNRQWHFDASEADVLQLLADDLQAGRIPIPGAAV